MGKFNKQQKMIIAAGAIVILIVIIVTAIICYFDVKNKREKINSQQQTTEATKVADKDDTKQKTEKETTKKKTEKETTKKEETTDEDESAEEVATTVTDSNNGQSQDNSNQSNGGTNNSGSNNGGSNSTVNNSSSNGTTFSGSTDFGVASPSGTLTSISSRISVHDPSIEYDPATGKWYIFGSHKAFGQSSDLITWSYATGNGSSTYHTIFAQAATWSALGGPQLNSTYKVDGNLWAPDVIYNHDMGKWCMYMSVNGDSHYSSIAMATADSITGPYTYVGTVVYSGFNASNVSKTDYQKATGTTDVSRYVGKWATYGTNAIDPCVLYDKNGQLWMVYGSWVGGTFMLKLDNETGLRDYSYTYTLDTNSSDGTASDPYLGKRISGGFGGTGEGPYIVWDEEAGYYYLYLSYCGLNATDGFSGYQMRMFRSTNIEGPYTDAAGHYANRTSSSDDQSDNGIKIMGNYFFSSLSGVPSSTNAKNGYMSPGHNSAIVDNEGNRYVVYHTRFNVGAEYHEVRVHQQFLNEDGWLVTAPYEYLGSKISSTGYSSTDIVGTYEYINHGNETTYNVVAGMLDTLEVTLNADGTISGDVTGTWTQKSGTPYATMVIGGVTYKGVFFKQYDESTSHTETMTFTLIGSNNLAIWGSKVQVENETGKMVGSYTFENTSSLGTDSTGSVGNATINGCTSYSDSSRGNVLAFDGSDDYVQLPAAATKNYTGYTIMMWFKATDNQTWNRLFDLGDSTDKYMFLTLQSSANGLRFAQTVNGNSAEAIIDGSAITTNTWNHVAVTVSAKTKKATLYLNGKKVGTTVMTAYPSSYAGNNNYLGKSQWPDPYFKGYMDNVYIFNYALSSSEITTYMNK